MPFRDSRASVSTELQLADKIRDFFGTLQLRLDASVLPVPDNSSALSANLRVRLKTILVIISSAVCDFSVATSSSFFAVVILSLSLSPSFSLCLSLSLACA
eukprot:TRINITY_DN15917_c4_g1_i1.p1 TRINITY_DN15917_c4_g1~~TRINITY_DN15917_c4_g1_i1.p1  ORF type:complete len:101 (+),score=0.74 TRINITY_DN15917_c4_g1_i1:46-348(+)